MEPLTRVTGVVAPLDRANVDTDQIIPKQFLKRIERSGYGPFLFYDWRRAGNFILDQPSFRAPAALATPPNLPCGSSRAHASPAVPGPRLPAPIQATFAHLFHNH